jgi:signal transduction histidine kinase
METRRTILILSGLSFLLVGAIFVWQITAFPSLRIQIRLGLDNSMEKIAEQAATGLDEAFNQAATVGADRIKRRIPAGQFKPQRLLDMNQDFLLAAASQPISNAWFAVFPRPDNGGFYAYEFRLPNRFRKSGGYIGDWRNRSNLTDFVERALGELMAPYETVDSFAANFWESALDSNISFVYNKEYQNALLIGTPFFNPNDAQLSGFIFSQINTEYLESIFIRKYFNERFWQEGGSRGGLEKRHLQISVMSGKGNKLIYSSVAFGRKDFNHVFDLGNISSFLSVYKVGVTFRDSNIETVADAIYARNIYLAIALFVFLLVLLVLLYRAAAKLLRLSRLKTEFVANVSHEIKTPLASIRLATDTLKLGRVASPEQMQPLVRILDRETERLQYLIHTLLDFSQLEAGKKNYRKVPEEVAGWSQTLMQHFQEKTGPLGRVEAKPLPGGQIEIDRKAIEQVLDIFIDNARKYSAPEKEIVLHLHGDDKSVTVGVQDFGIGIRKEDQHLVFEKFVRIGNLDVHNIKGHGIGLSIAQGIIQNHGAKIGVKSKLGEGSTFFITFPLMRASKQ